MCNLLWKILDSGIISEIVTSLTNLHISSDSPGGLRSGNNQGPSCVPCATPAGTLSQSE